MVTKGRGWRKEELGEGGQKAQISSFKINTMDMMYNMINIINIGDVAYNSCYESKS